MTEDQKRVIQLLDSADPEENLRQWIRGYIPNHYKRLTIDMEEAVKLAEIGAEEAYAYFGERLYFTQSLLMGAVLDGKYKEFVVVTNSQYGKSWLCGQISLLLANKDRKVYVAGGNGNTTDIIMNKVMTHIQNIDDEVKSKLLEPMDKIERLQTSLSKKKLSFRGGGLIEGISLGESFNDPKKGNLAIGRGGDFIVDEASMVSDDTYAELGRREFADASGEKYISFEISNPHNPGRFFDKLTSEHVPDDRLIVWMDARTALEEGRIKSKEQVIESEFFQNKSTCKRYLLCELEDYAENSLFGEPVLDDSNPEDGCDFFLGVDSAYKGKDDIYVFLTAITPAGMIRVLDFACIDKKNWIDGATSIKVTNDIMRIINRYGISMVCADIGFGVWLVENMAQRASNFSVKGINFGSGTTKFRKASKHFSAVYGENMRSEMHLDLQDLMDNRKITFTSRTAEALKHQMNAVQAIRKPNGKTGIIPKDEIKNIIGKSPDELDAALLSVHAALLYSMSGGTLVYQDE